MKLKKTITAIALRKIVKLLLPIIIGPFMMCIVLTIIVCSILANDQNGEKKEISLELGNMPKWITSEMVCAAIEMMNENDYPASVVLGQMILEGGHSGSELADPPYYNCLGQKSPSFGETGNVVMHTQEAWGVENAAFSVFPDYVSCMKAWGHKFTMPPYVDNVMACLRDPVTGHYDANSFIEAVWKSGYATDPNYVSKVIDIMTSYDLYRFNYFTMEDIKNGSADIVITGNGKFIHPCPDMIMITSQFGEVREFEPDGHKGIDYAAVMGTPTYAADGGKVTYAGWAESAGNLVVIDHGNGLLTKYMHHSKVLVKVGDEVEKGQKIGEVGSTGNSTGPHLHFQVEVDGKPVQPEQFY